MVQYEKMYLFDFFFMFRILEKKTILDLFLVLVTDRAQMNGCMDRMPLSKEQKYPSIIHFSNIAVPLHN
jgi:hypothetical protein